MPAAGHDTRAYLDELKNSKGHATLETDGRGQLLLKYAGDYNVVVGGHVDLDQRLKDMARYGVDMQVISLTTPGVEREAPELGIDAWQKDQILGGNAASLLKL